MTERLLTSDPFGPAVFSFDDTRLVPPVTVTTGPIATAQCCSGLRKRRTACKALKRCLPQKVVSFDEVA